MNIKPAQTDCKDYTKILDKDGKDIIKGVILFEGWNPTNQPNLGELS